MSEDEWDHDAETLEERRRRQRAISEPQDTPTARFRAWYKDEELGASWPERDDGESMSHYIVRNDMPALLDLFGGEAE